MLVRRSCVWGRGFKATPASLSSPQSSAGFSTLHTYYLYLVHLGSAETFFGPFPSILVIPPPFIFKKPIASPHWFVRCSFSPPSHSSCPLSRYYTPSSLKTLVMELYIKVLCVDTVGSSILIIIIPVKNPAHLQGKVPALGPAQLQSTFFGEECTEVSYCLVSIHLFIFFCLLSSSSLNFHPPPPPTSTTDN